MTIDWMSLLTVAAVTVFGAALIVTIMAASTRLLDRAHIIELSGQTAAGSATGFRIGGYALLVVVGVIALFGIWVIVPYFH